MQQRHPATRKSGTGVSRRPNFPEGRSSAHRVPARFRELVSLAQEKGLLAGRRTTVVRARMPEALVAKAKARTGLKSDTDLLEVALANLAVADDYADWLFSRRGTVPPDVDLEF